MTTDTDRPDIPLTDPAECPDCDARIERAGDHDPQCPLAGHSARETAVAARRRSKHESMDRHIEQRRLHSHDI